jgi:CDP-4-dehydro-6-deoxyglucose reductase
MAPVASSVASYRVTLQPSGHSFITDGSDPILQAALDAGLTLPYGCRNGACGACKGKVLDGLVDHGAAQDQALSTADRAGGLALFCCAKPLSDLVLECREVGTAKDIPVRIMPCRVQTIERAADDVIILGLKLPANERLQFLAGQYIEFLLKDGKRRAFSIANAPHDDGFLQLHIRLIAGGEFTGHVFGAMKEKDILRFQGPYGSFFLREESVKPAILVAGGTGFAPIKAIVEHAIHSHIKRPLEIYWGSRNRAADSTCPTCRRAGLPPARPHPLRAGALRCRCRQDAWTGRSRPGASRRAGRPRRPRGVSGVCLRGAGHDRRGARNEFVARGLLGRGVLRRRVSPFAPVADRTRSRRTGFAALTRRNAERRPQAIPSTASPPT